MADSSRETTLKELNNTLLSLSRIFAPHEINPTVRPIVSLVRQARNLANNLGELMTNGDDVELRRELANVNALLLKTMTAAAKKDEALTEALAEIEKLKKLLEAPKSE